MGRSRPTSVLERTLEFDPPGSRRLRLAFATLWVVDLIAAASFFVVPYASELNPVTVFFYDLFGLAGVALAAICYAAVVVVVGNVLSAPIDGRFVAGAVVLYAAFAFNNVVLLLFRQAPLEMAVVAL
ncbi:hypothetical protein [Halopiger aswanensis]|uniref:Uncharacterized protein n=1 Tax=Halopiger aswanensis TaxID=148449 RepID=A0A3R7EGJ4_9EURY|nr:hypothetical protein [Halopiger aswanensis]RKD97148.1 hypothetical protein ATJ93_0129 [Halopiger aswanensis]